jgi:hypothetical protein
MRGSRLRERSRTRRLPNEAVCGGLACGSQPRVFLGVVPINGVVSEEDPTWHADHDSIEQSERGTKWRTLLPMFRLRSIFTTSDICLDTCTIHLGCTA